MSEIIEIGKRAKAASVMLAKASPAQKDEALFAMAKALLANKDEILVANARDMAEGKKREISKALMDRLLLTGERLKDMASGLYEIAALKDPIGEVMAGWRLKNGLKVQRVRVPLGVIAIIYEARPNVTVDAAGLSLKASNAVILRGSSIAVNSNLALTKVIAEAAAAAGLPKDAIQSVADTDRALTLELMKLNRYVDVLIPRGGASLINSVIENSTVPVIETGVGNCHVYIDSSADHVMAKSIIINAKCQRPGVCNAAESLLIHQNHLESGLAKDLLIELSKAGVEIYGCERVVSIFDKAKAATEDDWHAEYLDLKIAVKIVTSLDDAIAHIYNYGTKHSEAIVTQDYASAKRFTDEVDAAAVYVNASTRFTDGGQYGLGAEMGISTQKLHVRGPMGVDSLTSMKYVALGTGQIRG